MSHKRTAEEPEEDVAEQQYDDDEQYEGDNNADDRPAADDGEPVIRFRSYMPRDETLQENVVQSDLPEIVTKPEFGVDVSEILQSHSEFLQKDVEISDLAPKKANWDLKRDVERKLKLLENSTKESIRTLAAREAERRRQEEGDN